MKFGFPFTRTARLKAGETVMFSWIVFKSRVHRDRVNAKVMNDIPAREHRSQDPAVRLQAHGVWRDIDSAGACAKANSSPPPRFPYCVTTGDGLRECRTARLTAPSDKAGYHQAGREQRVRARFRHGGDHWTGDPYREAVEILE